MTASTSVRIRRASKADAMAIAYLCGELGYPATAGQIQARLDAVAQDRNEAVFVALVDGEVMAWLHAGVVRAIEYDACVEIRGLVVDARQRGKSLGAALMASAEDWARSLGILDLRVRSQIVRERAHRFYLRQGYEIRKTQLVFVKRLTAD
jgi:GNAT superfamily N-acetyltransferase